MALPLDLEHAGCKAIKVTDKRRIVSLKYVIPGEKYNRQLTYLVVSIPSARLARAAAFQIDYVPDLAHAQILVFSCCY